MTLLFTGTNNYVESSCEVKSWNDFYNDCNFSSRAALATSQENNENGCQSYTVSFSVFFETQPVPPNSTDTSDSFYLLLAWYVSTSNIQPQPLENIWGSQPSDYLAIRPMEWSNVSVTFTPPVNTTVNLVFIAHHNDECRKNVRRIALESISTSSRYFGSYCIADTKPSAFENRSQKSGS